MFDQLHSLTDLHVLTVSPRYTRSLPIYLLFDPDILTV